MTGQPTPEAVEAVAAALREDLYPRDGRHHERNAATVLAFIRDALHRDGDDADAIRETLGLEWDEEIQPHGNGLAHFERVVGEWREVQP